MGLSRLFALLIIVASFSVSVVFFPSMPETMVSHWGLQGEPNGTMPKLAASFLLPVLSLVLLFFLEFLPNLDPLKKNYASFMGQYRLFITALLALLFYLHVLTLAWNAGYAFNFMQMLAPAFGFFFYILGMLMEKAKMNWFVGIRTPWTMSNPAIWKKTHALAGDLFRAAGIIIALGVIMPELLFPLMIAAVALSIVVPIVYSFAEYKALEKKAK